MQLNFKKSISWYAIYKNFIDIIFALITYSIFHNFIVIRFIYKIRKSGNLGGRHFLYNGFFCRNLGETFDICWKWNVGSADDSEVEDANDGLHGEQGSG